MTDEQHPDVPHPTGTIIDGLIRMVPNPPVEHPPTGIAETLPANAGEPVYAWSQGEQADWDDYQWEPPKTSPWMKRILALLVLVAAVLVAVLGYLLVQGMTVRLEKRATTSTSATAYTPPAHPAAPSVTVISPTTALDVDVSYIDLLQRVGIVITDRARAIDAGHLVCSYLAQGRSAGDIAAMMSETTKVSIDQAEAMVAASKFSYCPGTGR